MVSVTGVDGNPLPGGIAKPLFGQGHAVPWIVPEAPHCNTITGEWMATAACSAEKQPCTASSARNARSNPFTEQGIAKPVGIIASICQQIISIGQRFEQGCGSLVVACLSFGQVECYRFGRMHCKQRGVLSSIRLLCVRYSVKEPFFQQACRSSVRFEVSGVDH